MPKLLYSASVSPCFEYTSVSNPSSSLDISISNQQPLQPSNMTPVSPSAATTTSLSPATAAIALPLTFGLEFEHILAFHSSLLLPHLPPNTLIIKDLPPSTRESLLQTSTQYLWTRSQYNGWGLTSPSTYPLPRGPGFHNECLAKHGCRGYADEALKMERAILLSGPTGTEAVIHAEKQKRTDFARWHLTTDHSLVGAMPEELAAVIGESKAGSGEWDSAPLELVSPPFALDEEAGFEEIAAVLQAVRGGKDDDLHHAFTDQWCGLHVHIGLPPNSSSSSFSSPSSPSSTNEEASFPLPLLQHLAYITTLYEPAISSLHPPSRRPDRDATGMDLASNRDLLLPEPDFAGVDWDAVEAAVYDSGYASSHDDDDDDRERLSCLDIPLTKMNSASPTTTTTTTTTIVPTTASFPTTTTTAEEEEAAAEEAKENDAYERRIQQRARDLLFPPHRQITLQRLCDVMSSNGQRGRVVNWTYLARTPGKGPRTVEFRQHEGCLDAAEVRSWVGFCGALVRWAERGCREEEEGRGLEEIYGEGALGWGDLVERMGGVLGGDGGEWVRRRAGMWG